MRPRGVTSTQHSRVWQDLSMWHLAGPLKVGMGNRPVHSVNKHMCYIKDTLTIDEQLANRRWAIG